MSCLVIHGGAGAIPRADMTDSRALDFHRALRTALGMGEGILSSGGSSLDAVEAVVVWLEDCPLFNAGRGSSFTRDGRNEMEASIMDGRTAQAGAVALLRHVRNPIQLARSVMIHSSHVMLAGDAAENFAELQGLKLEPEGYFFTRERHEAMIRLRGTDRTALSEDTVLPAQPTDSDSSGTVGAVAVDARGNLAAAASSGGTTNKYPGRVGQAGIIGAGLYADNNTCAVACTGQGEAFIRLTAAFDVSALMAYQGMDVGSSADRVIHKRLSGIQGRGGLIAVDRRGDFALPYNTEGMYRGWINREGQACTAIYDAVRAWPES